MPPGAPLLKSKTLGPVQAILYGTLAVSTLDALDAIIFFGVRGVRAARIFQAIASGLLGRAAFDGGTRTVMLGVGLHYFIALSIVCTYSIASRRIPLLLNRPLISGVTYGVMVYGVMNLIVIPLSAVSRGPMSGAVILNGLLIHAAGVGLPSAMFAHWGNEGGWPEGRANRGVVRV